MDSAWAPLATVLIAVVSGWFAWLAAKRKGSGTVQTSEAQQLWDANQEFRTMLIEEARERTNENVRLRQEHAKCHEDLVKLEQRIIKLERMLTLSKKQLGE